MVNNVGGTFPRGFLETSPRFLTEAFSFNVATAHALTRAAVPLMLKSPDGQQSVVTISSMMGRTADRGFVAYGTAKAALAHWTRMAARDLAPRIRVNGIYVGSIMTSALEFVAGQPELMDQLETKTPLGRVGEPEDIAAGRALPRLEGGPVRHRQADRDRRRHPAADPRPRDAGPRALSRLAPARNRSTAASVAASSGVRSTIASTR